MRSSNLTTMKKGPSPSGADQRSGLLDPVSPALLWSGVSCARPQTALVMT